MAIYLTLAKRTGAFEALVMEPSDPHRLWIWTTLVVLFLHIPIVIIVLYAFNASNVQGWPITDWTTKWFGPAIHNGEMQQALILSLKAGALATGIALVLGRSRRSRSTGRRSSGGR
jgi:ABC-type spermidine/putrescine transport system permease subunit II